MIRYEPYYDNTSTYWGVIAYDETVGYWYVEQPPTLDRKIAEAAARGMNA